MTKKNKMRENVFTHLFDLFSVCCCSNDDRDNTNSKGKPKNR